MPYTGRPPWAQGPQPGPGPDPETGPRPGPHGGPSRSLRRPVHQRMLGGVCAGVARYLGVDVVLIRLAFLALTFFAGTGFLLYAAGWALIPEDGADVPPAAGFAARRHPGYPGARPFGPYPPYPGGHSTPRPGRRHRHPLVPIAAGLLAVWFLSHAAVGALFWPFYGAGMGIGVWLLLPAAAAVALVVAARKRGTPRLGLLAGVVAAGMAAVAFMIALALVAIVVGSGVSLGGGVGSRDWAPAGGASLAHRYRLAAGDAELDLSQVTLPPGRTYVTASVGVGKLVVDVPAGMVLSLDAASTTGSVDVFGMRSSGVSVEQTSTSGPAAGPAAGSSDRPTLVLSARVAVGEVVVRRG